MNKDRIVASLFATGAVLGLISSIAAQSVIQKQEKIIVGHQSYEKFLEKLITGLETIVLNPTAYGDPIANRLAVETLMLDLKSEMLLDGVDFDLELRKFNE